LTPSGIASAQAFGNPALGLFLTPTGIGSAETFGLASATPGAVFITPTGISTAEIIGLARIPTGAQLIVTGINSGEQFGSPRLTPGVVVVFPKGIGPTQAFGNATILGIRFSDIVMVGPNETRTVTLSPEARAQILQFSGNVVYVVNNIHPDRIYIIPVGGAIQVV
jgi:hypothetical protein